MQLHKISSLLMSIRFYMYEEEIQINYQEQKEISSQKFCIFKQSSHTNSELPITNPDPDLIQRLFSCWYFLRQNKVWTCTGKSFSEALILASSNPQYEKRLFIVITGSVYENCKLRTCSEHVVYINCSECQNKRTICVHNMF